VDVRPATPDDAAALARARAELIGHAPAGPWFAQLQAHIADGLTGGDALAAFVIDAPGGGLAACALGSIHQGLPGPDYSGRTGHVHLVVTAPAYRRRGYATAVTAALVDWLQQQECQVINLNASGQHEGLYRVLGFTRNTWAMRLASRGSGVAAGRHVRDR
jgi:RimJ/RimL family protein N-acetyltransferase